MIHRRASSVGHPAQRLSGRAFDQVIGGGGGGDQTQNDPQPHENVKSLVLRSGRPRGQIDRQNLPRRADHIDRIADLAEIDGGSGAQPAGAIMRYRGQGQDQQTGGQHRDGVPGQDRGRAHHDDGGAQRQQPGAGQGRAAIDQVEGAAVGEAGDDAQRAPAEGGLSQGEARQTLERRVQAHQEDRRARRRDPGALPQRPGRQGEQGEGQIGEPLRRDRPGRMVPARLMGEAPGVKHQQVGGQGLPTQHAVVDAHPHGHRAQPQGHDAQQGEEVQRIDPRDPRPQEAAIREALLGEGVQIDVAEDEAR
ncbi:hypothetical protein D3C71_1137530 [compost metagenome]